MKLYNVPRNTLIALPDGTTLLFHRLDGMYSVCTDSDGQVWNISAHTEVTVKEKNEEI